MIMARRAKRRARAPNGEVGHQVEEAGQPEISGDDHHAEQQHQGVRVDVGDGLSHGMTPRDDHGRRADDGDAGPVDAEDGRRPRASPR